MSMHDSVNTIILDRLGCKDVDGRWVHGDECHIIVRGIILHDNGRYPRPQEYVVSRVPMCYLALTGRDDASINVDLGSRPSTHCQFFVKIEGRSSGG